MQRLTFRGFTGILVNIRTDQGETTVDSSDPDEELQILVQKLTEELTDSTRKIGLYLEHVGIVSRSEPNGGMVFQEKDFREHVENGEVLFVGLFTVGDVAWEKRTIDPEQDEFDKEARTLLPDPVEMLREKIRRAQEEGRDPFEEGDDG